MVPNLPLPSSSSEWPGAVGSWRLAKRTQQRGSDGEEGRMKFKGHFVGAVLASRSSSLPLSYSVYKNKHTK